MCHLKYGVWTYHGYLVDLVLKENHSDRSTFMTNGEWVLQGNALLYILLIIFCGASLDSEKLVSLTV